MKPPTVVFSIGVRDKFMENLVDTALDDRQLCVKIDDVGRLCVSHHLVDMCNDTFFRCSISQGRAWWKEPAEQQLL